MFGVNFTMSILSEAFKDLPKHSKQTLYWIFFLMPFWATSIFLFVGMYDLYTIYIPLIVSFCLSSCTYLAYGLMGAMIFDTTGKIDHSDYGIMAGAAIKCILIYVSYLYSLSFIVYISIFIAITLFMIIISILILRKKNNNESNKSRT